jgi:penicillin-binding protein 1C
MQSKIMDVPTFYGTFVPQNASKKFSGLVSLENVLIHSLNVPAVRLLNKYGLNDFYCFLKRSGLKGLFRPPGGYGLTLILGGAEASLWELVQLYLALGNLGKFREIQVLLHSPKPLLLGEEELFSQGASWLVLEALKKLDRPGSEYFWQNFTRPVPVAWKTGTSYGQRDAWAIGINKQWCIGVWVGNFTGEENAELSGVRSAAPLLFSIFSRLVDYDKNLWFEEPTTQLKEVECCQKSGYPAKSYCPQRVRLKQPVISFHGGWCPFHQQYLIDKKTGERVSSLCWEGVETEWVVRFIVPPRVKEILSKSGHSVDVIPPWAERAGRTEEKNKMEILYPPAGLKMFIPRDIGGHYEKIVLQAQHQIPATQLFWFLNGKFVGKTKEIHKLAVDLSPGEYTLTVQDKDGFSREVSFFVYKKEERRD